MWEPISPPDFHSCSNSDAATVQAFPPSDFSLSLYLPLSPSIFLPLHLARSLSLFPPLCIHLYIDIFMCTLLPIYFLILCRCLPSNLSILLPDSLSTFISALFACPRIPSGWVHARDSGRERGPPRSIFSLRDFSDSDCRTIRPIAGFFLRPIWFTEEQPNSFNASTQLFVPFPGASRAWQPARGSSADNSTDLWVY